MRKRRLSPKIAPRLTLNPLFSMFSFARFFLCASVFVSFFCLAGAAEKKKSSPARPNIVLMLADDLGYGDLSCYGASRVKTPNIDRLAAQGVRLADAHAPAAVCQPTRYGVLAGRYHWRAKRTGDGYYFQDNEILMPETFRRAGYATAAFGKWHLGWGLDPRWPSDLWDKPISHGPRQAGFDYTFMQASGHEWPPFVFVENEAVYKLDPSDPLEIVKENPSYWPYAGGQGSSRGAKAAHAAYDVERLDLTIAQRAGEWMAKQKQPFMLYLPFFAPHVPILPAREFQGSSQAGIYGDFVQQLDQAVGIVLDTLDRLGLAENTLVVFTSDNGGCHVQTAIAAGHNSNAHLLGLKTDAWEGGHRVPFVARWPGRIPVGAKSDALLSLTDLFPTFAAAAGVQLPRDAAPDGLNQLPVLRHPEGTPPIRGEMVYSGAALRSGDWVYLPKPNNMGAFGTFYFRSFGYQNSQYDADGKLLPDALPEQLYNLREDPSQKRNVLEEYPQVAAQMAERLRELKRQSRSR
jgi:arylsulfatase A